MSADAGPGDPAAVDAARELALLQGKVAAARTVLTRLLQETVVAESLRGKDKATQLLEANELLVVAALKHHAEAESGALALHAAMRSAELDSLTQLPNRVLLLDRLTNAIAGARRRGGRLALLFLDLDDFKQVNDALGHAVGDDVLKLVAYRLASSMREADTVSRHGGDEFLILLTEVSTSADVMLVADKVIATLAMPSTVGDHVLRLTTSVGISLYPDDGEDPATLIDHADAAMYRAKQRGKGGFVFYGNGADAGPAKASVAIASLQPSMVPYERAREEYERRQVQLQAANEQLVLAALSAQDLRAAAERAQRRQAEFMALVAKELADPLSPIRLAMTMLGRVGTDEPLLPRVQSIVERQAENMARLSAAVQDVSRANTASLTLEHRTVDLKAVIDGAVAACRPAMDTRLQRFGLDLPGGPVNVSGDPERLEQIVTNLLDNASRYTADLGQIELAVTIAGDVIDLVVSDNGIGIAAQALPDIFEPMAQDVHAIGFNGVGLGIGLTVVRALVEAHGGSVVATSDGIGRGSRFTVTLPLVAASSAGVAFDGAPRTPSGAGR